MSLFVALPPDNSGQSAVDSADSSGAVGDALSSPIHREGDNGNFTKSEATVGIHVWDLQNNRPKVKSSSIIPLLLMQHNCSV